jgi:threonine/homoserine/homoserine lactone efflux protein
MTLAWLTTYAVVIATAGRVLRVSRVQRPIEAVSGVVLVGLGARVAIDAR